MGNNVLNNNFKQQWMYLFYLKRVDKALMKETRIQSREEGGCIMGRTVSSALLGALGTHPGSGGCHRASPFHQLLQANGSQHFGGSLSNFLLGTFSMKLLWTSRKHFGHPLSKWVGNLEQNRLTLYRQNSHLPAFKVCCAIAPGGNVWPVPGGIFGL